jgi:hypothetical protein
MAPDDEARLPQVAEAGDDEPPVVARMVVEIRSDGSRTIARGALEDRLLGETVQVHAEAATPLALVGQLARALARTPVLARLRHRGRSLAATARGLLPGRRDDD